MVTNCFELNMDKAAISALLILVDRLCFDRYKIDYIKGCQLSVYSCASRLSFGQIALPTGRI